MRVLSTAGLIALFAATAADAGPWPRGEGQVFLSFGLETRIDLDRLPLYVLSHGGTIYAEYGTGARTTLGLDLFTDFENGNTVIGFVRRTLTAPEKRNQIAVRLGAGYRSDATGGTGLILAGASWGRGFESRWGGGWMTVDGQVRLWETGETAVKLDGTLGLKPNDDWMVIGQVQLSDYPGADLSARLSATAVRKISDRLSLEFGVLYGLSGDSSAGITASLWSHF